jgi:CRP-like cAMP-binding protein
MQASGTTQLGQNSSDSEWFEGDVSEGAKGEYAELAAGARPVSCPRGDRFFVEGQPATGIFLLRTGRAKESALSNSGREAIVRLV